MKYNPFEPAGSWRSPTLTGQNKDLHDYLAAGRTISFLQARQLGFGNLDARIAILRNHGIIIHERGIRISNIPCTEYSLQPFNQQT